MNVVLEGFLSLVVLFGLLGFLGLVGLVVLAGLLLAGSIGFAYLPTFWNLSVHLHTVCVAHAALNRLGVVGEVVLVGLLGEIGIQGLLPQEPY